LGRPVRSVRAASGASIGAISFKFFATSTTPVGQPGLTLTATSLAETWFEAPMPKVDTNNGKATTTVINFRIGKPLFFYWFQIM
jgi:hypothetical protein